MPIKLNTLHFLFLLLILQNFAFPNNLPFYDRYLEGWYWYQTLEGEKEEEVPEEVAVKILETYQQTFERALKVATASPTKKNIKAVMELQQKSAKNAEKFADVWGQILLENPELNGQLSNPTSYYGIATKEEVASQNIRNLILEAKETYTLLFFFKSNDPFSQAAAQMVRAFKENTGWNVVAISLDGGVLPEFPKPRFSKDEGKILGIDVAPAYMIVNPKENLSLPVGYGTISVQSLKQNIFDQLNLENPYGP